jgi:carbonic anhydrase/acetyltransferase-like protein (isoleucine patch superfamily)
VTNVFNGFLPAVTGSSNEPGSPTVKFEPPTQGPQYLSAKGFFFTGLFPQFRVRVTGQAWFFDTAARVAHHASRGDSIRADEGQPIIFHSAPTLDSFVSIHSPVEGQLIVGKNVQFGTGSVLLGGPLASTTASVSVGDDVTIGAGAVVDRSNIGAGATIGARALVSKSTVKPGEVIPPGTILISDKVVGTIGW